MQISGKSMKIITKRRDIHIKRRGQPINSRAISIKSRDSQLNSRAVYVNRRGCQ